MIAIKLNDIHGIIKPMPSNLTKEFNENIDSFLENLIVYNNQIFSTHIFNHLSYSNQESEKLVLESATKHTITLLKKNRLYFRELSKKNKFTLDNITEFIDVFYKLITKVNSILIHYSGNTLEQFPQLKWSNSVYIHKSIEYLCEYLLNDNIIVKAINLNIFEYDNLIETDKKNVQLFKFYNLVKIINEYNVSKLSIDSIISTALLSNIPKLDISIPIDSNLATIYNFKNMIKYYNDCKKYYYYISDLSLILEQVDTVFNTIINSETDTFIQEFIITYSKCIIINPDAISKLLTKINNTHFKKVIEYYSAIFRILNNQPLLKDIVIISFQQYVVNYNTSQYIQYIVNIINDNILNKQCNEFAYIIARFINLDEFITLICNKLIFRAIYQSFNEAIEIVNYNTLARYFCRKYTYKYKSILNDIINKKDNLLITSYYNWSINYEVGHIDSITNLGECSNELHTMISNYNIANTNKHLIIYPHLSIVDCTFTIDNKPTTIIMTVAHMLCLEQYTNPDYCVEYVALYTRLSSNLVGYTDEFIKNIINQLIGTVLVYSNTLLTINKNMPSKLNLLESMYSYEIESIKKIYIELAHERTDIVQSYISSYLKQSPSNIDTLYSYCKTNIKVFDMTKELFDESIQYMLKHYYISIDETNVNKIHYVIDTM